MLTLPGGQERTEAQFQEHSATQDFVQVGSDGLENSGNVLKGAFGLLAGVTPYDLLGSGIEAKLSAHENESTAFDRL